MTENKALQETMPKVSIGITCFNAEDTIADAIRSALAQTYPSKEIIVYDDCSSDASLSQIEPFVAANQVRLIRGVKNLGYPSALNALVEAASGEFLAFFDDDDVSRPDRIGAQIALMLELEAEYGHQDIFCYSARKVMRNEASWTLAAIGSKARRPQGMMVAEFLLLGLERPGFSWGAFGSCTMCARRAQFKRIGAFDPEFRRAAEWDFAIRAAAKGAVFASVSDPVVTQRLTPGQGTEKSNSTSLYYTLKLRDKHANMFPTRSALRAARMWARARAAWARKSFKWRFYVAMTGVLLPQILPSLLSKSRLGRFFGLPRCAVKNILVETR